MRGSGSHSSLSVQSPRRLRRGSRRSKSSLLRPRRTPTCTTSTGRCGRWRTSARRPSPSPSSCPSLSRASAWWHGRGMAVPSKYRPAPAAGCGHVAGSSSEDWSGGQLRRRTWSVSSVGPHRRSILVVDSGGQLCSNTVLFVLSTQSRPSELTSRVDRHIVSRGHAVWLWTHVPPQVARHTHRTCAHRAMPVGRSFVRIRLGKAHSLPNSRYSYTRPDCPPS